MANILKYLFFFAILIAAPTSHGIETFADLEELVRNRNIRSIDELIPQLPERLRRSYSLIFESRSQQGASRDAPRVVLYSPLADLMLAYTGSPQEKNANNLEVIEFNWQTKVFDFKQIEFASKSVPFFNHAPGNCVSCHASQKALELYPDQQRVLMHPNWDSYPDWPGYYGSSHHPNYLKLIFAGSSFAPKSKEVIKAFQKFQDAAPKNPRYAPLVNLQKQSDLALGKMNSTIGTNILNRNFEKVVAIIRRHPRAEEINRALKEAFKLTASDSTSIQTMIDDPSQEKTLSEKLEKWDRAFFQTIDQNPSQQEILKAKLETWHNKIEAAQKSYAVDKAQRFSRASFVKRPREVVVRSLNGVLETFGLRNGIVGFNFPHAHAKTAMALEHFGISPSVLELSFGSESYSIGQSRNNIEGLGDILPAKPQEGCENIFQK